MHGGLLSINNAPCGMPSLWSRHGTPSRGSPFDALASSGVSPLMEKPSEISIYIYIWSHLLKLVDHPESSAPFLENLRNSADFGTPSFQPTTGYVDILATCLEKEADLSRQIPSGYDVHSSPWFFDGPSK